jgi:hypothetical protein
MNSPEARQVIDVPTVQVEQVITRSRALTALERLEIYNRAYFARLLECLREEYPVLVHALGEDTFDEFAVDYLQKHPSRSYTLNQLGAGFPAYLAQSRADEVDLEGSAGGGWADFFIDLAVLERTFAEVFDGPGVEGQSPPKTEELCNIALERWSDVRVRPVCCLRLLRLRYPVHGYYTAVRKGRDPAVPRPRTTHLAVTRRNYVVRRYTLSRAQYALLEELVAGQPVGEAVKRAVQATRRGSKAWAARLWQWFRNWTAEGLFASVEPGDTASRERQRPEPSDR